MLAPACLETPGLLPGCVRGTRRSASFSSHPQLIPHFISCILSAALVGNLAGGIFFLLGYCRALELVGLTHA